MHWGHTAASPSGPVEVTYAEQMEAFGLEPPQAPEVPECGVDVLACFWELNARRPAGFEQLCPVSYTEIHHYLELTGKQLDRVEVGWLIQMDNAWLHAISEQRAERQEREREKAEAERSQGKR